MMVCSSTVRVAMGTDGDQGPGHSAGLSPEPSLSVTWLVPWDLSSCCTTGEAAEEDACEVSEECPEGPSPSWVPRPNLQLWTG